MDFRFTDWSWVLQIFKGFTNVNYSADGVAVNLQLGVEYAFNKHISTSAAVGVIYGSLPKPENVDLGDKRSGIARIFFDLGFNYHF